MFLNVEISPTQQSIILAALAQLETNAWARAAKTDDATLKAFIVAQAREIAHTAFTVKNAEVA